MYRLCKGQKSTIWLTFYATIVCLVCSCTTPRLERSAAVCPLPPPPPACTPSLIQVAPANPALRILPVTSLSSASKEEFYDGTRTIIGNTFADAKETPLYTFTANTGAHWSGHYTEASIGGKRWFLFASDSPVDGHTDIYYASSTTPAMYKPLYGINTPCDELSPWVDVRSSTLYFSSPAHGTLGGYDIHSAAIRVSGDSLSASNIQNVGLPFNSKDDELFYNTSGDTVYVTSNRRNSSDFDVYSIVGLRQNNNVEQQQTATIEGYVKNEQTQEPIADAVVTAKNQKTQKVISTTTTDTLGKYVLQVPVDTKVNVVAEAPGVFFDTYTTTVPKEKTNQTVVQEKPLSLPLTFVLRVNFPTAIYKDPYEFTLDSDGNDTETKWQTMVQQLSENVLNGKGTSKLILIGHTDDVGTDQSNMILGKQRVDFIIDRLVENGVPREMMEGRSAGESLTPSRRKNEDITQWRKRCRRVELVRVVR